MAQTFTTTAVSSGEGVQYDYPQVMARGVRGQIASGMDTTVISGSNETAGYVAYGIPVVANSGGVLPNSFRGATTAGAILGILARSHVNEKDGRPMPTVAPTVYTDGVPPLKAGNILTKGQIYLEVMEAVAPGDTLRYHKSGANSGKWGKTASAGNTLALAAGNWVIRKSGDAQTVMVLELNTPGALTFTAD
jgi:hypothetical protein